MKDDELQIPTVIRKVWTLDELADAIELQRLHRAHNKRIADEMSDNDHDGSWRGPWL